MWDRVDCIRLAQNREKWPGFCEHGNEPSGYTARGEFLG
jgi:hypothetical protein